MSQAPLSVISKNVPLDLFREAHFYLYELITLYKSNHLVTKATKNH